MDNKDWLWTVGIGAAVALLWWVARNTPASAVIPAQSSNPNDAAFPVAWDAPMTAPFSDPNFNTPPSGYTLNINVNNPYANMLSSAYMPLFGFVGIAQGAQFE